MNRLCPSDTILSEYLSHTLEGALREQTEEHISSCPACRQLVKDAYMVAFRKTRARRAMERLRKTLSRHLWLAAAMLSLAVSFFIRGYFLQLVAFSFVSAMVWHRQGQQPRNIITFTSERTHADISEDTAQKKSRHI